MTDTISNKQALKRMFGFLKGKRLRYVYGTFFYSAQAVFTSFMSALLLGWTSAAILSGNARDVYMAGLYYLLLIVIYFAVLTFGTYNYVVVNRSAEKRIKKALFTSFVYSDIEDKSTAKKGIAAINTEADTAAEVLYTSFTTLLNSLFNIGFSAIIIFVMDWRLGLVSLGAGLLSLFIQSRFAKPMQAVSKEKLDANSAAVGSLSGILGGAAAIRAFSLEERVLMLFDKENRRLLLAAYRETRIKTLQSLFTNLQSWVSLAAVLGLGGWLVATGRLSFALLIMVPNMCMVLGMGLSSLGNAWAGFQAPLEAARRVCAMLDKSDRINKAENNRSDVEWNKNSDIKINGLNFSYEGANAAALKNISLNIPAGKMLALVGESGCGKSTLLRVICGLYERGEQNLHIGNLQLGAVKSNNWRQHFALVDQSCKLFDMTIAENIALGTKGATQAQIEEAAKAAGAYDFITELEKGFNTPCGEGGAMLSGGQKQRIAIARALCRRAPVLMLDEATAALDNQSQTALMQTIEELRKSHTIIMVTHDLRQSAVADEIAVLKNGELAELGTHKQLIAKNGEYSRLWSKEN